MERTTYIGIIKNEKVDTKTLVVAENEADALAQVMAKFKDIEYTEDNVTIVPFMRDNMDGGQYGSSI